MPLDNLVQYNYNTPEAMQEVNVGGANRPRIYVDTSCKVELPQNHPMPHNFYYTTAAGSMCRQAHVWSDNAGATVVSTAIVVDTPVAGGKDRASIMSTIQGLFNS